MKLTREHIYPYMPYGLEIKFNSSGKVCEVCADEFTDMVDNNKYLLSYLLLYLNNQDRVPLPFKLLLKPLSELTPELLDNIEVITGTKGITAIIEKISQGFIDYILMVQLFKQHYDVFGLIDKGLAEAKK